jgi:signal transduction histidine kinase
MPDDANGTSAVALQRQRDAARRSLLRANTAVALVLLFVLALATAAVWLGWRATRLRDEAQSNQSRAELAEAKARADLWRAYVSEAKATRLGTALERREAALESIHRAAAITSSPELRNEAIATLALPGFQIESSLPFEPSVNKFAFDPALRRCACGLTNGDVVIRSLSDGRELQRLRKSEGGIPQEQSWPAGLVFSPDGRRLSVRYLGGAFAVWDIESRRTVLIHNADKRRWLAADANFSSDGRYVVGPVFAPRDGIAVIEVESGREVAHYAEFNSYRHAAVRPGAPMFAANNGTNVVAINWETGARVEFPFPAGVRRMTWSADGDQLVIGGNLLEVHVWDFAERKRRVFSGHKGDVWDIVLDPGGTRMATSAEDGLTRIWDLRNGRLSGATAESYIRTWGEKDRVGCARPNVGLTVRRLASSPVYDAFRAGTPDGDARTLDISADGVWAVSMLEDRGLLAWNLNVPGEAQWIPIDGIRSACFHPAEPRLFITKKGGPEVRSYSVATNASGPVLQLGEATLLSANSRRRLDRVTLSASGNALAWVELAGGNVFVEKTGDTNRVRMRGTLHSSVAYQSSSARGGGTISLSPDGRWLACGYGDSGADVCDTRTGERVARISRRQGNIQFSPDGRFLVLGENDACRMFRVSDWSLAWHVPYPPSPTFVAAVAFSPDSKMVVVAKSARAAVLIDVATGRELAELESPAPAPIGAARWTPDGQRIVLSTRENQLDVWKPVALQRDLSKLGLGWNSAAPLIATVAPARHAPRASPALIGVGALVTVALVAVVAVLSLRRHRTLIQDFTRTEALAVERERELEGERELGRLKSNFVSMVSHEFRTPLGIIQSSAQILDRYLDRLPPPQRREQLVSITNNVKRMAGLIDEVLLLGKVEAGQMRFAPKPMDLASFCRQFTDEMLSATNRRCPIRLELSGAEFPRANADEDLLRHILGNLISNATKYSPPGSPVNFSVARSNGSAVFIIHDRGIGIPAADQDKLFVAFQRGSNVSEFHGTGLGLTIVKRCVELHGGELAFTSEEEKGTTFTVRIPLFARESEFQSSE